MAEVWGTGEGVSIAHLIIYRYRLTVLNGLEILRPLATPYSIQFFRDNHHISTPRLALLNDLSASQANPAFTLFCFNSPSQAHETIYTPAFECLVRVRDIRACIANDACIRSCRNNVLLALATGGVLVLIAYCACSLW